MIISVVLLIFLALVYGRTGGAFKVQSTAQLITSELEYMLAGSKVHLYQQMSEHALEDNLAETALLLTSGVPVLFSNLSGCDKLRLWQELGRSSLSGAPLSTMAKDSINAGDSAIYFIDLFHDLDDGVHYRIMNLPQGYQDISKVSAGLSVRRTVSYAESDGSAVEEHQVVSGPSDTYLLDSLIERDPEITKLASEVTRDIHEYLVNCGGVKPDVAHCFNYVHSDVKSAVLKDALMRKRSGRPDLGLLSVLNEGYKQMVPESGAVWREVIESQYRYWAMRWGAPFPFDKEQVISHRLNSYWYLYLQAPPYQQMYYAFMLVDGLHNPNTQLSIPEAVGGYLSNLEIKMQAARENGEPDSDNIFWIKSNPPTQNTQHTIGQKWESTDSFSLGMNLGFKGEEVSGGINFNYTKTFTASYSEKRDITDWGVVENTNPVVGRGDWRYSQSWPVDMQINRDRNFPRNWEQFYAQPWNPCIVKEPPNLSRYALGTHDTMVWAVRPQLNSNDGRYLPVNFDVQLSGIVTAITCEIYDGHHKMAQWDFEFTDMNWTLNVAGLNNIARKPAVPISKYFKRGRKVLKRQH